jgi:hypothetical protein
MVQVPVTDEPQYETIPEGSLLIARVEAIAQKTINYADKKTGQPASFDVLEWSFKIIDQQADGGRWVNRKPRGKTDAKATNRDGDKFREWAEAIMAREITVGTIVDTDDLVDRTCCVEISLRAGKDGRIWEEVVAVFQDFDQVNEDAKIPF